MRGRSATYDNSKLDICEIFILNIRPSARILLNYKPTNHNVCFIGLQPIKTRAELDSSTVLNINI